MNKKKLVGIVAIVAVALTVGIAAFADTWTSCVVQMTANSASVVEIKQSAACDCSVPFTSYDWNGVVQGQTYQCPYYICNEGTVGVYITYLPTIVERDDNQTRFILTVNVTEHGNPCQLTPVTPQVQLPEKDNAICDQGFWLGPGKVIKINVEMYVQKVYAGGNWAFDFTIFGCAP